MATDEEVTQGGELELWQPTYEELAARLTNPQGSFGEVPSIDSSVIQAAIAARVLEIEDPDAALSGDALGAPINSAEAARLGPITLTGGAILKSAKGGPGFYFLLEGDVLSDGSHVLISTGAHTVLSQLARRMVSGPWPTPPIEFVERDEPTGSGFRPISIKLASVPTASE